MEGFAESHFHATVAVPLRAGGEVVGVIGLAYAEAGRTFGPAQIALVERFAQLAALALENARLYTALQQSEELHRRIVDCSTDLISLVDLEGTIVVISPSVLGTLGVSAQEMVGTYFAQLVHPDDLGAAQEMFATAMQGSFATSTVRVRHADGSWVLLDAIASVIVGPDGQPQHVLATGRDVTERERLQEQLRQAQKMESIGRLAGGIAHDFNNLLTAISGYAELMLMDFDADAVPTRDSAEQIARAAARAASLTGQLLAFSRKQVLRPQLIDLNEVVGGMASMLARMLGEDVVLSTAFDPELGPTHADPTQIEQVVLNLALNGRDAMPDGGSLAIRTAPLELGEHDERPHPDLEPGSYVTLTVRDTGVGMEPDLVEKVFEPFFTTKGVGEGTGPRARDGGGDRQPERRRGLGRLHARRGHDLHGLPASRRLAAQREQRARGEQQHAERPRPGERDLVDAEPAVAVDRDAHRELAGDQEPDRRRRADPRRDDGDRQHDDDAHAAAADPVPPGRAERVAEAGQALAQDEQDGRGDERREREVGGERLERPDPLAEPAHHGDLDRAREPRDERE